MIVYFALKAGSRQQTADSRQQTADSRHQTPDTRHQTPDGRQQTAERKRGREGSYDQRRNGDGSPPDTVMVTLVVTMRTKKRLKKYRKGITQVPPKCRKRVTSAPQ
jgi:hypothetical protein